MSEAPATDAPAPAPESTETPADVPEAPEDPQAELDALKCPVCGLLTDNRCSHV